jgi:hypothetical protein
MAVWEPPMNRARAIGSVAMAPIAGPPEFAWKLNEAMIQNQPQAGQPIAFLHPQLLEEMTSIQLASFDGQPSDIAGLSAARRANADVVLQGQILHVKQEPGQPSINPLSKKPAVPLDQMSVSWTVVDVATGEKLGSRTMTIDRSLAEAAYPELLTTHVEPMDRVIQAVSRESWSMFTPKTKTEQSILVLPWFAPGSGRVRQGNGFARQGRWDLAEAKWQDAASKHPYNRAAWHNLGLAAVAREDFELGRERLQHAKRWYLPNDRGEKAEEWLDEKQHDYHRAFSLPDREAGWLNPDPPPAASSESVPSTEPQHVEDLPWWTAIPGTKPDGWSWNQWLFQPRFF